MGITESGISVVRLGLVSSAAVGFGSTDAVFLVFVLEALQAAEASKFLAFLSLAAGASLSILTAPLAGI